MAQRRINFSTDEHLARRLAARAADLGKGLEEVMQQDLAGWLGDWGLSYTTHVVQPGETLRSIATRYYSDPAKSDVVAAFNDIADPNRLRVARVLRIPEVGSPKPLPKGESPYIFGLHDRGGEHCMAWAGRKGWVLCSEALGCNPNDWRSKSYADLGIVGTASSCASTTGTAWRAPCPDPADIRISPLGVGTMWNRHVAATSGSSPTR